MQIENEMERRAAIDILMILFHTTQWTHFHCLFCKIILLESPSEFGFNSIIFQNASLIKELKSYSI